MSVFLPLAATDYWLAGSSGIPAKAMLLDVSAASIPDSAAYGSDLTSLEIDPGGGYAAGGVAMPSLSRVQASSPSRVVEWSAPSGTWESAALLTVTFRWVALLGPGDTILAAHDVGSTTLAGEALVLVIPESSYIAGSFPVLRARQP